MNKKLTKKQVYDLLETEKAASGVAFVCIPEAIFNEKYHYRKSIYTIYDVEEEMFYVGEEKKAKKDSYELEVIEMC